MMMTAAIFAGVIGIVTAQAEDCPVNATPNGETALYGYCGDHVRKGTVLRFTLNTTKQSADNVLATTDLANAVRNAITEWDRLWPVPPTGSVAVSGSPGDCSFGPPRVMCYDGVDKDRKSVV